MKKVLTNKSQEGFVALFTVLLTSVLLAMAVGIASIALKEIVLSSSASDGNKAFYAADSGIECALYFDRQNPGFGNFGNGLRCNDHMPLMTAPAGPEIYIFKIPFGENDELCADITVERGLTGLSYQTRIESKGSNTPCDDLNNPKRVERSVRVTY